LASASSSSSTGACPLHSERRWPRINALSAMRRTYSTSAALRSSPFTLHPSPFTLHSHVIHFFRQLVERRMAVDLVFHRVEHLRLRIGIGRHDLVGAHHPDAYAFLPACEHIARSLQRHTRVARMHTAAVLVVQPVAAADEHFPQRPFLPVHRLLQLTCSDRFSLRPVFLLGALCVGFSLFRGVCQRRLPHPRPIFPGLHP